MAGRRMRKTLAIARAAEVNSNPLYAAGDVTVAGFFFDPPQPAATTSTATIKIPKPNPALPGRTSPHSEFNPGHWPTRDASGFERPQRSLDGARMAGWIGDDHVAPDAITGVAARHRSPFRGVAGHNVHLHLVVAQLDHARCRPEASLAKRDPVRRKHALHLLHRIVM